jgi:hypothetical protein
LAGIILGIVSVILALLEPTPILCTVKIWFFSVAYVMVFGSLFGKVYRLYLIVSKAEKLKRRIISVNDILKPLTGFLVIEIVFLAIWTAIDMPTVQYQLFQNQRFAVCAYRNLYWWIIFVSYKSALLLFGAYLAYQSRNFDPAFNESKIVATSLYVMLVDLLVMIPIGFLLSDVPLVPFLAWSLGILIAFLTILVLTFLKPMVRILTKKEPKAWKTTAAKTTVSSKFGSSERLPFKGLSIRESHAASNNTSAATELNANSALSTTTAIDKSSSSKRDSSSSSPSSSDEKKNDSISSKGSNKDSAPEGESSPSGSDESD